MVSDCAKVKDKYWDKEDKDQVKGALYGSHGQRTYKVQAMRDIWILYIVSCHLPRGSKLRWREDIGGELPSARGQAFVNYYTEYTFIKTKFGLMYISSILNTTVI